jgi:hypothetical protein
VFRLVRGFALAVEVAPVETFEVPQLMETAHKAPSDATLVFKG